MAPKITNNYMSLLMFIIFTFFTTDQFGVCERVEGGRSATQCDLVMMLPGSQLAADYTVVDFAHTLEYIYSTRIIIITL